MKKFFIVFLLSLLYLLSPLCAQEVVVVGDYDLTIPDDYEELKAAYIQMTGLYLDSEADLEISVQNFKNLKTEYDNIALLYKESEADNKSLSDQITNELNPTIIDLENRIGELTSELEKWIKPDPFGLYGGLSLSNEIVPNVKIGAFLNFVLFEQVSIQVEYRFLDEYSIGIGYKF